MKEDYWTITTVGRWKGRRLEAAMFLVQQGQWFVTHGERKAQPHALDVVQEQGLQSRDISKQPRQVGVYISWTTPPEHEEKEGLPFFMIPGVSLIT